MKNRKIITMLLVLFFSITVFGCDKVCEKKNPSCQEMVGEKMCQKIGQMFIVGFGGYNEDDDGNVLWDDKNASKFKGNSLVAKYIDTNHIGGIILFTRLLHDIKKKTFTRHRNVIDPNQVKELNYALQQYNSKARKEQGLENLPLFISVDQEGGVVDRLPASMGFPETVRPATLGANEDRASTGKEKEDAIENTYEYANSLAKNLFDLGFNMNFAPVVDVNINPDNPIIGGIGRSFSSSPEVVVDQAREFIKAFNANNIIPVLKHFPGHGSSTKDSHKGLVDVTKTYDKTRELYPYIELIKEGHSVPIMTTHVINGQLDKTQCRLGDKDDSSTWCPGTMSKKVLTDLLRKEMGFHGLIVSDDMTMGAITEEYSLRESLGRSINAGVDIFIVANNWVDQTEVVINTVAKLIKDGEISEERIDKSYRKISDYKRCRLLD